MKNESPEYRQLSDGSLWVFIERRGWTFLRVERSAGAQTVTGRDGSDQVARDGALAVMEIRSRAELEATSRQPMVADE